MSSVPWLAVSKALEVVHELRSCGLDADVDLPRICVAGKQSSGKSSVIEALTGVSVPRSSGTCTRCAFEISTRWADCDFCCSVSIRCELDGTGSKEKLPLARGAKRSELPGLLKVGQQILLHSAVLKRHSAALKEGSVGLRDLEAEVSDLVRQGHSGKLFSRDVVVVDMQGRDLKDLELIDLPGLIQSVDKDEEKDLIPLIQELCASYLRTPNTLIVMCCPMNDDMENQAVRMMAKQHDKSGKRTIGALTKADLMPEGDEAEWLSILQNSKFELVHGYFATRNPPQSELDSVISPEDARQKEEDYFSKDPKGQSLFSAAPDRCGVGRLRDALSRQLCAIICQELPRLQLELAEQLSKAEADFQALPAAVSPELAQGKLVELVDELHHRWSVLIEATGDPPFPFWVLVRKHYKQLRDDCFNTRPRFLVGDLELDVLDLDAENVCIELHDYKAWREVWRLLDDGGILEGKLELGSACVEKGFMLIRSDGWFEWDDDEFGTVEGNRVYVDATKFKQNKNEWPVGWRGRDAGAWLWTEDNTKGYSYHRRPQELYVEKPRGVAAWPITLKFRPTGGNGTAKFTLAAVQARIEDSKGREVSVPGGPACYSAARMIIRETLDRWAGPAKQCGDSVEGLLRKWVQDLTIDTARQYPRLQSKLVQLQLSKIDQLKKQLGLRIEELLKHHEGAPDLYTQNDHYLKCNFNDAQLTIRRQLGCTLQMEKLSKQEQDTLKALMAKAGHDPMKLIAPHDQDDGIWCMSAAYAYHKVAFKRFCDVLPRTIDETLLRGFLQSIRSVVFEGLKVFHTSREGLHHWFEEEEQISTKRRVLASQIRRLRQGLQHLESASQPEHLRKG